MAMDSQALEVLKEVKEKKRSLYLGANHVSFIFQTQIYEIKKSEILLLNTVPIDLITAFSQSTQFTLQTQMMRFESKSISSHGLNLLFKLDQLSLIPEARQSQRFPFEMEENVVCEFQNPVDPNTVLQKRVMDMSATGISFRSYSSPLYTAGLRLTQMKVSIDKVPYTTTDASVVYQKNWIDLKGRRFSQVGLKFEADAKSEKV